MTEPGTVVNVHVHVRTRGGVPPDEIDYAVEKLRAALQHVAEPVLASWLTLDTAGPGCRVHADVNVNGTHLHVHDDAPTLHEAIDAMRDRLRSRLSRSRRRPQQGPPAAGQPARGQQGHTGGPEWRYAAPTTVGTKREAGDEDLAGGRRHDSRRRDG